MITPISEADWINFHFSFFINKNYRLALKMLIIYWYTFAKTLLVHNFTSPVLSLVNNFSWATLKEIYSFSHYIF